jgi:hypothetical protein
MFIHGIGNKQPGNSLTLLYNLSQELGFDEWSQEQKEIKITNTFDEETPANLKIIKLSSPKYEKDITFYEFVWSDIAQKHKTVLEFDDALDIKKQRAELNGTIKHFINTAGVDPLVYLGAGRNEILESTVQSMCIMMKYDWTDIKSDTEYDCFDKSYVSKLNEDKYVLITHSLGSKIAIDALQYSAEILSSDYDNENRTQIQETEFDIFMLSNQLPLLQIGREKPEVAGQYDYYCRPDGKNYSKRAIAKTEIYAFSDPNDLLSYSIPNTFKDKYIDSRICPVISNININVAEIRNPLGLMAVANPLEAHTQYDEDERVISILANGYNSDIVKESCNIIKLIKE